MKGMAAPNAACSQAGAMGSLAQPVVAAYGALVGYGSPERR